MSRPAPRALLFLLMPLVLSADLDPDALRWKSRIVLVFAAGDRDPDREEQERILESARCGVEDRDIVTVLAPSDALRRRYRVSGKGFRFLLIGKDGTVKMRRDSPVTAEELFARIDAMPMRRSEMRRTPDGGCAER